MENVEIEKKLREKKKCTRMEILTKRPLVRTVLIRVAAGEHKTRPWNVDVLLHGMVQHYVADLRTWPARVYQHTHTHPPITELTHRTTHHAHQQYSSSTCSGVDTHNQLSVLRWTLILEGKNSSVRTSSICWATFVVCVLSTRTAVLGNNCVAGRVWDYEQQWSRGLDPQRYCHKEQKKEKQGIYHVQEPVLVKLR